MLSRISRRAINLTTPFLKALAPTAPRFFSAKTSPSTNMADFAAQPSTGAPEAGAGDMTIACRDCGTSFIHSSADQVRPPPLYDA